MNVPARWQRLVVIATLGVIVAVKVAVASRFGSQRLALAVSFAGAAVIAADAIVATRRAGWSGLSTCVKR